MGRWLLFLLMLAGACQREPGVPTAREAVEFTLTALDRGDLAGVRALQIPVTELRTYVACGATGRISAEERWKMLEVYSDAELASAVDHLKGRGLTLVDDYVDEWHPIAEQAVGDDDENGCRTIRALATQAVDLQFFVDGDGDRMTLTVGRFAGRWRLVFLRYGRGFNN